jgi:NAD(P)-dependent dehydrogenase (short-subunit alcohol dehydrogenase family)
VVAVTGYDEARIVFKNNEICCSAISVGGPFPPLPAEHAALHRVGSSTEFTCRGRPPRPGARTIGIETNVSDRASIDPALARVRAEFGPIVIAVSQRGNRGADNSWRDCCAKGGHIAVLWPVPMINPGVCPV